MSNLLCHRKPGMNHSTVLHPRPCGTASCTGAASLSAAAPPLVLLFLYHIYVCDPLITADQYIWRFCYICSGKVPLCNYFSHAYMWYTVDRHTKLKNVRLHEYDARLELKKLGLSLCQSTNQGSSCLSIICRINTHRVFQWSQRAFSFFHQLKYPHILRPCFDLLRRLCNLRKGPLKFKNYFV